MKKLFLLLTIFSTLIFTGISANYEELKDAIKKGDLKTVKDKVEVDKLDVNHRYEHNNTPLHFAVKANNLEMTTYLVETYGANVDARNDNGETPLYWATANGSEEIANILLLNGANVHERYKPSYWPSFIWGIRPNRLIAAPITDKYVAIQKAIETGDLEGIQDWLETDNLDINHTYKAQETMLHIAVKNKQYAIVKYLVEEQKANVNTKTYKNDTPLHFANYNGDIQTILYLLSKGANPLEKNTDNISLPEEWISKYRSKTLIELVVGLFGDQSAKKQLILTGEVIEAFKKKDLKAIKKYISNKESHQIIKNLFKIKPEFLTKQYGSHKQTLLSIYAKAGNKKKVAFLLNCGVDINQEITVNGCIKTALHDAFISGNLKLIKYMIEKNAKIENEDLIMLLTNSIKINELKCAKFFFTLCETRNIPLLKHFAETGNTKAFRFLINNCDMGFQGDKRERCYLSKNCYFLVLYKDNSSQLHKLKDGKYQPIFKPLQNVERYDPSDSDELLSIFYKDNYSQAHKLKDGTYVPIFKPSQNVVRYSLSDSGELLSIFYKDNSSQVHKLKDGTYVPIFKLSQNVVRYSLSDSDELLSIFYKDNYSQAHKLKDGTYVPIFKPSQNVVRYSRFVKV